MCAPAFANDARVERMLRQLDPDARFEQVCDLEAMKRIGKDKTYRPERSIVGALETPKVVNSTMSGNGGAFKSKGQWYQFSFKCQTTADHMKVQAFSASRSASRSRRRSGNRTGCGSEPTSL